MTSIMTDISDKGWSVTPGWLTPSELTQINQAFTLWQQENRFTPAKIGQATNLQQHQGIRGDETWWFDLLNPPKELASVLERIQELKQQFNRELFLGLKDWEVHLASYPAGAFYKRHLDRHVVSNRKLTIILYLNEQWSVEDGGELVMYDRSGNEFQRLQPIGGTLVFFLSEEFPHEVLPAKRERRSLTGWFLDASKGVI